MLRGNLAIQNPNYVKKLQLKQFFCCETHVSGKLVASPSLQATGNILASDGRVLFYY